MNPLSEVKTRLTNVAEERVEKLAEQVKEELVEAVKSFNPTELVPSTWDISGIGSAILAVNSVTGRKFEGPIKAFNKLLRP